MIYLDYAAASPLDPAVKAAMEPFWQDLFYNPSATYLAARDVARQLESAREVVASCLGARPAEIVFTAGGTEADNLAIHGIMQQFPDKKVIVSAIEHEAVLKAAEQYAHKRAPVTLKGTIDLQALERLIDDETVLLSVMYANNEVGTIQPIAQIGQLVRAVRAARQQRGVNLPLYLHTDASQAPNYLDIHVSRLGVDLMTINGGKVYGPKQTGALFVAAGITIVPLIRGGGQERGLRSGTENVAGYVGLAVALQKAQRKHKAEVARLQQLQQQFEEGLVKIVPDIVFNGHGNRLPNFVHVTLPGLDNERLMMQLDEAGIACAVGSACQASNEEPSHVLMAMGLTQEEAQSSLRFSMGRYTTKDEIIQTLAAIRKILTNQG